MVNVHMVHLDTDMRLIKPITLDRSSISISSQTIFTPLECQHGSLQGLLNPRAPRSLAQAKNFAGKRTIAAYLSI